MASISQLYSDYQFSTGEFSGITSVIAQENYGCTEFSPLNFPVFYDNNNGAKFESYAPDMGEFCRVPVNMECFSDQFGANTCSPNSSSSSSSCFGNQFGCESNNSGHDVGRNSYAAGFQFFGGSSCEYGEDFCEFAPNWKAFCHELTGDNWRIQCNQMPANGNTNNKVGRYTAEERKDRILRYLQKRNQRNFNKTIKYACRKTLADRRIRVRGRFARNNELCEDETTMKNINSNPRQDEELFSNNSLEMKNEDDDWLQEAVGSLMYPYIEG